MVEFLAETFLPVTLMVILIIIGVAWLIRLGLFFYFRFNQRNEPNPHENKETMGLPKGAIRTFFALSFTALSTLVLLNSNELVDTADKKWILLELGAIITFYFGSKSLEAYQESKAKLQAIEKAKTPDEAVKAYERTVELQPDWVEAYVNLGGSYIELRCYEEAVKASKRAIEIKY